MTVNLGFGQNDLLNPVSWTAEMNEEGTAIELTAEMEPSWVVYSQHTSPEGPIPLSIKFTDLNGAVLDGDVEELSELIEAYSKMFEVDVKKFKGIAKFRQKLSAPVPGQTIKGTVTFMTCNDKMCLPPTTIPFQVN